MLKNLYGKGILKKIIILIFFLHFYQRHKKLLLPYGFIHCLNN
jgi:hypothetical protein